MPPRPSISAASTASSPLRSLLPALLVAGATQGLLLVRCGSAVRMPCCCPKESPSFNPVTQTVRCCGEAVTLPSSPAQWVDGSRPHAAAPVLVVVIGAAPLAESAPVDRTHLAPRLEPPKVLSRVPAHRAFLI